MDEDVNAGPPHDPRPRRYRLLVILAGLALIAIVGRIDFQTGFEASVAILYFIPVAFFAWVLGFWGGLGAAAVCALLALAANLLVLGPGHSVSAEYRDALIEFVVWASLATGLSVLHTSLRRERDFSRHDYITGLANWRAFAESGESELARMRRFGRPLTLVYVDLDDFKRVNDQLGHNTGDRLLRATASALQSSVREVDTVARLGGDEFVVLLPETGADEARAAVERMRTGLHAAMAEGEWPVTMSAGAATFVSPPATLDEVVAAADRLQYSAKRSGRDTVAAGTFGDGAD